MLSKGFKQGRYLTRKTETLLPLKVLGQWEQTGPSPGAPEAPGKQGGGCTWKEGPGLLAMVGRQGDPEDFSFSVGEGEELLVLKANRAPDPRSGSSVRWELCFMQVHPGWRMSAFCFLRKAISSKPRSCYRPRHNDFIAVPVLKEWCEMERMGLLYVRHLLSVKV